MPNFQQDVSIEEHDLRLLDANDNEIARLDQDGNLVVRRDELDDHARRHRRPRRYDEEQID